MESGPSLEEQSFTVPRLFYHLFFNPAVFVLLQKRRLRSVLPLVVTMAILSCLVVTFRAMSFVSADFEAFQKWYTENVKTFSVTKDGLLNWELHSELPYSTRVADWRIDFRDSEPWADDHATQWPEDVGVWVNRTSIVMWTKTKGGGLSGRSDELVYSRDWLPFFKMVNEPISVGEQLVDRMRDGYFVGFLLRQLVAVGFTIAILPMFSAMMLFLSARLARQPQPKEAFRKMTVLYLYTSIVPLIIATVYATVGIAQLSFSLAFYIAFFIYHIYVMRAVRRYDDSLTVI